ncbi:pirin family protein [Candidatus Thioglobus sp.]|uniref:pirin family protein n=1 Tax=Candidatus Thioglobus sp. TaxID=2026721 RepID=UPI003D1364FD
MEILHRDDMPRGGFAGLREHRLVTDARLFGEDKSSKAWQGMGNFVYLADAKFLPKGETKLHSHQEIDVISVMVEGSIMHEGSLEHGQTLKSHQVQVQRAGGQGFAHNEINPDEVENRMIQLWVLPEQSGQTAQYKLYSPKNGELMRIYGGEKNQDETLDSHTIIDVGIILAGDKLSLNTPFLAYITRGSGVLNGELVKEGDLIRDNKLDFYANDDTQLIAIHVQP